MVEPRFWIKHSRENANSKMLKPVIFEELLHDEKGHTKWPNWSMVNFELYALWSGCCLLDIFLISILIFLKTIFLNNMQIFQRIMLEMYVIIGVSSKYLTNVLMITSKINSPLAVTSTHSSNIKFQSCWVY